MSSENKKLAVVKVGGDMLLEESDRLAFAENLRQLNANGWRSVVLHGGGPQINSLQKAQGLSANKIEGRRITSEADLKVVKQALCGQLNVDLVASLLAKKVNAFGFHGASALVLEAQKRPPMMFESHGQIDLGEVGDIVNVNSRVILDLLSLDLTPVIASLGVDQAGRIYNINADTTAAAMAKAVNADMLILCTKVGGIFENIEDPATRIPKLSPRLATQLIADKTIKDGMIPKVTEALSILDHGVESIAIANADKPSNFIQMATKSTLVGTRLIRD